LDLNHCGEAGVARSDFSEWLRGRGQKLVFIIIFFLKEDYSSTNFLEFLVTNIFKNASPLYLLFTVTMLP